MPVVNVVFEDILFIIFFLLFSIAIGIVGFRLFAGFGWFKSFYNSAITLSSTGAPDPVTSIPGRTFLAFYSLYGGLVFLIIFAIVIGRIVVEDNLIS